MFFAQQKQNRTRSRWIVCAVVCVTLLIILVICSLTLYAVSFSQDEPTFTWQNIQRNATALWCTAVLAGGIILFASMRKIISLSSGGGVVARNMGGTLVTADTSDPLRWRLYHVVEEIAIASGTPVPEVYVLDNESCINAFAAGYSSSDAAVAVTQGALEKLNRHELQGVIAHEFSHILNGDMRINIRMLGLTAGLTVIASLGYYILSSFGNARRMPRSKNDHNGGIILIALIAVALIVIGYAGVFFNRWMKAALSHQREYLADASAVQFTRNPEGIAGALKKIAAYEHNLYFDYNAQEISHMMFTEGFNMRIFRTHPPLEHRIKRVQRYFNPQEIQRLAESLHLQAGRHHQAALAQTEQIQTQKPLHRNFVFDADTVIESIGNPDFERILAATLLHQDLPDALLTAAHSVEWAPEVLFFCLLGTEHSARQAQYVLIANTMGELSADKLKRLSQGEQNIPAQMRLPLLEVAFPALKRRPLTEIEQILDTIHQLIDTNNHILPYEYLLSRMITQYLHEAYTPHKTQITGTKKLHKHANELSLLLSVMTHSAYSHSSQTPEKAQRAFAAAAEILAVKNLRLLATEHWQSALDNALKRLNLLRPNDKRILLNALIACILEDETVHHEEHELLRVVCALIHIPLPVMGAKTSLS